MTHTGQEAGEGAAACHQHRRSSWHRGRRRPGRGHRSICQRRPARGRHHAAGAGRGAPIEETEGGGAAGLQEAAGRGAVRADQSSGKHSTTACWFVWFTVHIGCNANNVDAITDALARLSSLSFSSPKLLLCAGGCGGQRAQRRFVRTAEGGVAEAGRDLQHGAHVAGKAQGEGVRHQQGKV